MAELVWRNELLIAGRTYSHLAGAQYGMETGLEALTPVIFSF